MGWMEVEVSYLWLELSVDGNKELVGGASEMGEEDFPKLFKGIQTEEQLFAALDEAVDRSFDQCFFVEGEKPPIVYKNDDGQWVIDYNPLESKCLPLKLDQVKRIFFEFVFYDESGVDALNLETGEYNADQDLKDHPQEVLHGNDLGWLMEYGL